ncbi:MAG: hypothetical protein RI637_13075 [Acidimicrobiia bacterium]|nr:hypothetical protein [Acidimicrobiia bacterium]
MDEYHYEMAQAAADAERERGLNAVRSEVPEAGSVGPEFCEICGDDMHPVRRAHGYIFCVSCQEQLDSEQVQRGRGF